MMVAAIWQKYALSKKCAQLHEFAVKLKWDYFLEISNAIYITEFRVHMFSDCGQTAAWLAQLFERQFSVHEVRGSTSGRTNTQDL